MFSRNKKVVFFFCLSAIIFNFNHPLSGDEGAVLNGAWQIASGKIPYFDFFNFVAPGSFYFVKWSFDIFGYSYFSAKFTSVLLQLISVYAVYKISKYLSQIESASLVSAWLWLVAASNTILYPIINYNTYSSATTIIAVFFLIRSIKFERWRDFFLLGLMLSATIVTLQHKGLIMSLTLITILAIFTLAKKIRFLNFLTAIGATGIFPLIAVSYWGTKILYEDLIIWSLKHDISMSPIPAANIIILFAIFASLSILITKKRQIDRTVLAIIAASQIAAIISIYSRLDAGHLLINSFGFIIIFALALHQLAVKYLKNQQNTIKIIFAVFIISTFTVFISMNIEFYKFINQFQKTTNQLKITKIYAHPFLPEMYFELKLNNPYRYDTLFTGIHPQEYFIDNLTTLILENPKHIVISYDVVQKFNYTTKNPLDQYILTHYKPKTNLANLTFMEKID